MFKPTWKYPPGLATFEFTAVDETHTDVRFGFRSHRRDWLTLNIVRPIGQRMVGRQFDEDDDRLGRLFAAAAV